MCGFYLVLNLLCLILLSKFNFYFINGKSLQYTAIYFSSKSETRVNMLILPKVVILSHLELYSVLFLLLRQLVLHNIVTKREHGILPAQIVS